MFKTSIKKSNAADQIHERLTNLNNYHTYAVYENVCCGLFEHHKLVLSFQICIQILISEKKINVNELEFLLKGEIKLERKKIVTAQRPGTSTSQ
jgi:dynein heavy chain